MRELYPALLVFTLSNPATGLNYQPPICSLEGLRVGAGLGSVAGAVGGVAVTSGATTLATCPALMVSTLGHGLVRHQLSQRIILAPTGAQGSRNANVYFSSPSSYNL